jgi:folate-binding protein YgfZ
MNQGCFVQLPTRGVLRVSGADREAFLQGIVSNDVAKVSADRAVWSAFLTPQGKFLHEFFLIEQEEDYLLDCEAERRDDLLRRLRIYKLRSQVVVDDANDDLVVAALFGEGALESLGLPPELGRATAFAGGVAYVDPRLDALGARAILPRETAAAALASSGLDPAAPEAYERLRISWGVPDGSRDLDVGKSALLESGFDELHGVDWDKGCYLGQELTARTRYRGLVKRRLVPVEIDGPQPAPGTQVTADGKDAGVMRSAVQGLGLALLRLDQLDGPGTLTAETARLTPRKPDWAAY